MDEVLKCTHNAGFFSCCTIRLSDIINYFNKNKKLPLSVNSREQFNFYKTFELEDLSSMLFISNFKIDINFDHVISPVWGPNCDKQFAPYKDLNINELTPFIKKYFTATGNIEYIKEVLEQEHNIDYNNTCAIWYRGNDKITETEIASYEDFILQAHILKQHNPNIKFLVQTDESDFLDAFLLEFPKETFFFKELIGIKKQYTMIPYMLTPSDKKRHGFYFFASTLIISQCKHIITHSGNGAMWSILYRGNNDNVKQYLNGQWI